MSDQPAPAYQVLARKYRPETFADLVGQDVMVRVLKNAFAADRIAQAFILTGIRGTGKTTTARIIAKGLNCIGPDGNGTPTTEPCGVCEHCVAISEGRHVDVLEMDAASRTGVGDIREIIESVHYRAASARYKIYIIDEVHMLSTSAFNALLKTLEEPPPHVKFIFATTEIRKVPVTVLSRCQRFDLRRIEPEAMLGLLSRIAKAENAQIADDALALITRAAEGSARDATSLLDQAISHGAGETNADQVRAMLGLADRGRVIDLFQMILKGDAAGALSELQAQYADGADPIAVLRDLAEVAHWVSVLKITPDAINDPTLSPDERTRGTELADSIAMRVLTRFWQMLLKALEEVGLAPNAMMAAEMAVIRLTHMADLPDPGTLIRKLRDQEAMTPPPNPAPGGQNPPTDHGGTASAPAPTISHHRNGIRAISNAAPATALRHDAEAERAVFADYQEWQDVLDLIHSRRDLTLLVLVENHIRLIRYNPGRIEFSLTHDAPGDLVQRLSDRLRGWTGGQRWGIVVANEGGQPTIAEVREAERKAAFAHAEALPMVQAVMAAFPSARLVDVRKAPQMTDEHIAHDGDEASHGDGAGPVAPAEEWDPFEDEE